MQNVKVLNKGIDWNSAENVYWMHKVKRFETVKIILHGNAEFEATDVVLKVKLTCEEFRLFMPLLMKYIN